MSWRGTVPAIDVREADARRWDGTEGRTAIVVDVREADEFAVVRVEGAVHLPLSSFEIGHAGLPRDRPLLLLCAAGIRSAAATAFLLRQGWTDVTNVDGGIGAWQRAGLPVRHGPVAPGEGSLPEG